MMKLTFAERWILAQQHRILEILEPENSKEHLQAQQALFYGFEGEYEGTSGALSPPLDLALSEEGCQEVLDIMLMFRLLRNNSANVRGANVRNLEFSGFDSKSELLQCAYSKYLRFSYPSLFEEFEESTFESTKAMLPKYRIMVREWKSSADPYNKLSSAEVVAITNAP